MSDLPYDEYLIGMRVRYSYVFHDDNNTPANPASAAAYVLKGNGALATLSAPTAVSAALPGWYGGSFTTSGYPVGDTQVYILGTVSSHRVGALVRTVRISSGSHIYDMKASSLSSAAVSTNAATKIRSTLATQATASATHAHASALDARVPAVPASTGAAMRIVASAVTAYNSGRATSAQAVAIRTLASAAATQATASATRILASAIKTSCAAIHAHTSAVVTSGAKQSKSTAILTVASATKTSAAAIHTHTSALVASMAAVHTLASAIKTSAVAIHTHVSAIAASCVAIHTHTSAIVASVAAVHAHASATAANTNNLQAAMAVMAGLSTSAKTSAGIDYMTYAKVGSALTVSAIEIGIRVSDGKRTTASVK